MIARTTKSTGVESAPAVQGQKEGPKACHSDPHIGHTADGSGRVLDPVCGMSVDPHATPHRTDHAGRPHYFCSAGCLSKFVASPERYLDPAAGPEPVPEGTTFTCPMHPEVRQIGPGSCPICGMALEPLTVSLDEAPNVELIDMTRRFWIALVLTLPVFVLEMGGHLFGLTHQIGRATSTWIQLALATPVVLWAGWPFFERGRRSLVTRHLNMFTLISIGTGAAWIFSLVATLAPDAFPDAFRQSDGSVAVYFEAAAVITVLVLLGQVLELRARASTGGAIRALLDLAPRTARRLNPDGTEAEVCRRHGVSSATFYKWKAKFGGMDVSEARRLKALEDENAKLKRMLADSMLDNVALKDLLGKKW